MLSLLMAIIGVALIVQAVRGHGSIVSPRLLLGVLFVAAGGGRVYVGVAPGSRDMSAPEDPGGAPDGAADGAGLEHAVHDAERGVAEVERATAELAARSRVIVKRSIGSPLLFTIVYTSLASAIYFSLGVIAGHALGLTPVVFLLAALFFALTAMTYVEGASLHQDRGGSTVFARYAFNELISFVAGWAILLDYIILIAVTALLGDPVPARVLASARQQHRGAAVVAGVHRAGRARQHPRLRRPARAAHRDAGDRRPAPCRR